MYVIVVKKPVFLKVCTTKVKKKKGSVIITVTIEYA